MNSWLVRAMSEALGDGLRGERGGKGGEEEDEELGERGGGEGGMSSTRPERGMVSPGAGISAVISLDVNRDEPQECKPPERPPRRPSKLRRVNGKNKGAHWRLIARA